MLCAGSRVSQAQWEHGAIRTLQQRGCGAASSMGRLLQVLLQGACRRHSGIFPVLPSRAETRPDLSCCLEHLLMFLVTLGQFEEPLSTHGGLPWGDNLWCLRGGGGSEVWLGAEAEDKMRLSTGTNA